MAAIRKVKKILSNLEEVIRNIEKTSGQASQLLVVVGDEKYIVGDLKKRVGQYKLKIDDEYRCHLGPYGCPLVKNPFKLLAGSYNSFEELSDVIDKSNYKNKFVENKYVDSNREQLYIKGNKYNGYSVVLFDNVSKHNHIIGKIIYPLLHNEEPIKVDKDNLKIFI